MGVLFGIVSALFLSPYVIHRLGDQRYGVWALVFSLVDYYALVDFGFRSAVVKYSAHYRATNETARLESLVSTGLAYFSIAALVVLALSVLLAYHITGLFRVPPGDEGSLRFLTVTVGVGFAMGVIFGTCTAVLEGYQRFDITSRILIITNSVRVVGCFAVLYLGWGLRAMGICILLSQLAGYALTYRALGRLLPQCRFSLKKASFAELRQMMGYGARTFTANISLTVLNQAAPVMIGHFLTSTLVGYFVFPLRLLNYSVELVGRLGMVTGTKAAELTAHGNLEAISRMAVLINRYCLMLFLPLAIYLSIFGRQLLQVWINPAFAAHSAPLIPVLGAGMVIALAAQYNSMSILYGLAAHGALARSVFVEAVLTVCGLWYVIPRYGIFGAACVVSGLMILSRGIYVPLAVSRCVHLSFGNFMGGIYARPLMIAAPISLATWMVNHARGMPATWGTVLSGGAALCCLYYPAAFFFGLERVHRNMVAGWISSLVQTLTRKRVADGAGVL
jgi:O-antigen/teichoic acid export membrane protein